MADAEISAAAKSFNLSEPEFVETHMRLRKDRRGLCLKENPDGSCIFLKDGCCRIQTAKPVQCREFPSRWVNSLWGKMPLDEMQRDYPMLFNCAAFKKFLKENPRSLQTGEGKGINGKGMKTV
jgi:Fe-S-cluster containining protein